MNHDPSALNNLTEKKKEEWISPNSKPCYSINHFLTFSTSGFGFIATSYSLSSSSPLFDLYGKGIEPSIEEG